MTEQHGNKSSLIIAILAIALILAVGVGAMLFVNSGEPEATALVDATMSASEEGMEVPPALEDADVAETTEAVSVDVDAFSATRSIGNPDAPIKLVEYASLTCSHCASFHNGVLPALKAKYIDTGKVYLEYREFPLNDPALKATITARCLPAAQYDAFVGMLFKTQDTWANNVDYMKHLRQNAKLAGLSDEMFDACQNAPALKLKLAEQMQEGQDKYKISSTPTFIVNDGAEIIQGAQPLENFERVFRAVTNNEVGEAPAVE